MADIFQKRICPPNRNSLLSGMLISFLTLSPSTICAIVHPILNNSFIRFPSNKIPRFFTLWIIQSSHGETWATGYRMDFCRNNFYVFTTSLRVFAVMKCKMRFFRSCDLWFMHESSTPIPEERHMPIFNAGSKNKHLKIFLFTPKSSRLVQII